MKRRRFRRSTGSIRYCRFRRAAPSVTGLNTTVMARCRCMRHWIRNPAKCSARPPPATPARSLWSSSQRWSNGRRAREVHIILDNLSAHKSQVVRDFLAAHPNVHFHFTPTYSSWLNQVEIWFSKVERDVIARGIFTSVKRSEEHTSELQSRLHLVCRLLLEKKKKKQK